MKWFEQELIELLSNGLELLAEEVVDGPSKFLKQLPLHEWGVTHCPAIPYWGDEFGDPDLKHVLAMLVKLNARGAVNVPGADAPGASTFARNASSCSAPGTATGRASLPGLLFCNDAMRLRCGSKSSTGADLPSSPGAANSTSS